MTYQVFLESPMFPGATREVKVYTMSGALLFSIDFYDLPDLMKQFQAALDTNVAS